MISDSLKIKCSGDVYYPREDSDLLAEAVEKHAHGRTLDLGTGSGMQGIVAAKKGCDVTFADIDAEAIKCAKENAEANGVGGTFVKSNMFSNIRGKFDTIIFNPPYVPSGPLGRMKEKRIYRALDGGRRGRELIDSFLERYKSFLNRNGIALLLESRQNRYVNDASRQDAQMILKKHYFFEDLVVLLLH